MNTEPVELSTPTDAPVTDTPEAIEPAASIADHAAQFSPQAQEQAAEELSKPEREAVDKVGKFSRYRSESQKATPEDVAQINALTKELRAKEAELLKVKPDALGTDSPRVRTLRRQIKAIEADLTSAAPKAPEPQRVEREAPGKAAPGEFSDQEPQPEQFQNAADPLADYMKAWNRWDRKRETFEGQQAQASEARMQADAKVVEDFQSRHQAFASTTPDFDAKAGPVLSTWMPPTLLNAIVRHDKSAEVVYHLAQYPDLLDELILVTDGKPVSDASVAALQRRLTQRLQAVNTGSATPARPHVNPPRPPNPVRTGPVKAADELDGEASSIAEHARHFGKRR